MSKFHAGQRCMIVQSEAGNLGRIVTLVRFVGNHPDFQYERHWEIAEMVNSIFEIPVNIVCEFQLMPLDEAQTNNACTQTQGIRRDLRAFSTFWFYLLSKFIHALPYASKATVGRTLAK